MADERLQIRVAREADFTDCVAIAQRAWPLFHERPSIYHLFCKFFSNTSFIAERDGRTIGFLLGFFSQVDPSQAYIHLVAVDPPAQRGGIAARLYATFIDAVREAGVRHVGLIVNPDNPGSLAFHKRMGFTADLHEPTIAIGDVVAVRDYNGEGIHMVPFILNIEAAKGGSS